MYFDFLLYVYYNGFYNNFFVAASNKLSFLRLSTFCSQCIYTKTITLKKIVQSIFLDTLLLFIYVSCFCIRFSDTLKRYVLFAPTSFQKNMEFCQTFLKIILTLSLTSCFPLNSIFFRSAIVLTQCADTYLLPT